jgi:hypothetical protein
MEQFLAESDSDNAANMPAVKRNTIHGEHPRTKEKLTFKPQSAMEQFIAETDNENAANMQRTQPQIALKLTLKPRSKTANKASDSPILQQPSISQENNTELTTEKAKGAVQTQSTKRKSSSTSATTAAKQHSPLTHGKPTKQLTPRPRSSMALLHIPTKKTPTPPSPHAKEHCKNITTYQAFIRNGIH